jgi:hypothetical protein
MQRWRVLEKRCIRSLGPHPCQDPNPKGSQPWKRFGPAGYGRQMLKPERPRPLGSGKYYAIQTKRKHSIRRSPMILARQQVITVERGWAVRVCSGGGGDNWYLGVRVSARIGRGRFGRAPRTRRQRLPGRHEWAEVSKGQWSPNRASEIMWQMLEPPVKRWCKTKRPGYASHVGPNPAWWRWITMPAVDLRRGRRASRKWLLVKTRGAALLKSKRSTARAQA